MLKPTIINVTPKNIADHPATCFLNPEQLGYQKKLNWLKKRFNEGLIIKLLYLEAEKKPIGFIEYVPGEYAWRSVDAKGYLFIHCIWIAKNKYKKKGLGSMLVKEAINDAKKKKGVAVITSEGSFMAGKALFKKNKFKTVATADPSFELMIYPLKKAPMPKLKDWSAQLKKIKGLQIIYSLQCPWVARFMDEAKPLIKKHKIKVKKLKTAKEAQNAPSIYSVFNLINNGKLLADHYISTTRFKNIIKKELI